MKRIAAVLLAVIMLAAVSACGGNNQNEKSTPAGEKATQNAGNNSTQAPGDTGDPTAEPGSQATAEPQPVAGTDGLAYTGEGDGVMITSIGTASEKDIVIPSHIDGKPVVAIDEEAFKETDITSVSIPWTVKKIDEDAFAGCTKLQAVGLTDGLMYISDAAFYGCTSLLSVTLPSTLFSVGYYGFAACTSLEEVTVKGNTAIGSRAFDGDVALKTFAVESTAEGMYAVKDNAFSDCSALREIRFSNGLESIGSWCFSGLAALETVYLPKSVSKIDACAFLRSGVKMVYYAGSEDDWKAINIKSSNDELINAEIVYNYQG